jgi:phage portal protein BeeE
VPTILDRLLGRTPTEKAIVTGNGGTGAGVLAYYNDAPLWTSARSPRRLMKQAQELYHSHPWVHAAEAVVSGRAAGVDWHLEDEEGEEVTDESAPELVAIRDLFEKPQSTLPPGIKRIYRRALWQVTLRHEGLCGNAFWYLDQREGLTGTPAAFLYINPARMLAVYDRSGNTIGWKLDADDEGNGGVPITLDEVVQFEYDPPDNGAYGIGIVESAGSKAHLSTLVDRHEANVLASGGRLSGIFAPKTADIAISPEQWQQFIRDWRNVADDPNAAKRAIIAAQPLEHIRTSATPNELAVVEVSKMARDDITSLWGVPLSQLGVEQPAGLNSGSTKSYDEAILWQGAIHSRLNPFKETIQYGILDRIAERGGPALQLVIDEPSFDDESPMYQRASTAISLPMRNRERREMIGLEPFGDPLLDEAIWVPSTIIEIGVAPDPNGVVVAEQTVDPIDRIKEQTDAAGVLIRAGFDPAEALRTVGLDPIKHLGLIPVTVKEPEDPNAPANPIPPQLRDAQPQPPFPPSKARTDPLRGLRRSLDTRWEPALRQALDKALREQAKAVAAKVREKGAYLSTARGRKDWGVVWDGKREDARLAKVIKPTAVGIAEQVATRTKDVIGRPAKADTFAETVADLVSRSVGERITGINLTTRDKIAGIIAEGFDKGLSPADVANLIEDSTAFDAARAELIARTETALAYNESALRSYNEFGISTVEAIDGDADAECAERNGKVYPLDEALSITDHPNGTLDWAPVKADIDPMLEFAKAMTEMAQRPINITSPDVHIAPAVINFRPPDVHVAPAEVTVNMPEQRPVRKKLERDADGVITGMTEEID